MVDSKQRLAEHQALVKSIRPLLAGHHPALQGAALADLTALWLAGHPEELREGLLALHLSAIGEFLPVNARYVDDLAKELGVKR